MITPETQQSSAEVPPFKPDGLFWLEPDILADVGSLINETHLSTMYMGTVTHAEHTQTARQQIAEGLIAAADPLAHELHRALDIGYMYGGLMARQSYAASGGDGPAASYAPDGTLPVTLQKAFKRAGKDLNLATPHDNFLFFMRLRNVELAEAKSDVLAVSLAVTQDHINNQFHLNHKGDNELTRPEMLRIQSMFYAGALAGGLMASDRSQLSRHRVEIMRSMAPPGETVAAQLELGADDNLVELIGDLMSRKLEFRLVEGTEFADATVEESEDHEPPIQQDALFGLEEVLPARTPQQASNRTFSPSGIALPDSDHHAQTKLPGLENMNDKLVDDGSFIALYPAGFQAGPNTISLPLYVPGMIEPSALAKLPVADVEALLISRKYDDGTSRVEAITDKTEFRTEYLVGEKIAGVLLKHGLLSAYDRTHPGADVLIKMAAGVLDIAPEALAFSTGFVSEETLQYEALTVHDTRMLRRIGALGLSALVATEAWKTTITHKVDAVGVAADLITLASVLSVLHGIRLYKRWVHQTQADMNNLFDALNNRSVIEQTNAMQHDEAQGIGRD